MPGPPKKPTALKVIQGNPGKKPLPKGEPKPRPVAPNVPEYLGDCGLAKWSELVGGLEYMGVMTEVDGDVLGVYCHAFERWMDAEDHLRAEGKTTFNAAGSPILSPWVTERNQAIADMKKFGQELGIGPAARTRIDVKQQEEKAEDVAASILNVTARG